MKRFLMAWVMAGLVAVSAFAGDVSTSGSPAPAPSGTPGTTNTTPGDMPISGKSDLSSDALSAVLSVLSFLA